MINANKKLYLWDTFIEKRSKNIFEVGQKTFQNNNDPPLIYLENMRGCAQYINSKCRKIWGYIDTKHNKLSQKNRTERVNRPPPPTHQNKG